MKTYTDPVCGMTVKEDSTLRVEHDGQLYLFCNSKCLAKFQATPDDYLKPRPAKSSRKSAADASVTYICPMDPEVRQLGPGSCPKCGMALEPETSVAAALEYTCPMHPEIVRSEPGDCPICGMALEPRDAPAEENAELRDMTRRFWVSAALAFPVFVIAMVTDLLPQVLPESFSMTTLIWIEFALATPDRKSTRLNSSH